MTQLVLTLRETDEPITADDERTLRHIMADAFYEFQAHRGGSVSYDPSVGVAAYVNGRYPSYSDEDKAAKVKEVTERKRVASLLHSAAFTVTVVVDSEIPS